MASTLSWLIIIELEYFSDFDEIINRFTLHETWFAFLFLYSADFMKLTNEYIHLKSESNSKLNGYWTSDIGGINEVIHIWEYGILTEKIFVLMILLSHIFLYLVRFSYYKMCLSCFMTCTVLRYNIVKVKIQS